MAEKKPFDLWEFIKGNWGEVLFFGEKLLGLAKKADSDAPPEIKRLSGMFGRGDEIKLVNTVLSFEPEQQEILLKLFRYHFGPFDRPRSWIMALLAFRQGNAWRTLVTDLDEPSKKLGSKKVVKSVKLPGYSEKDKAEQEEVVDDQGKKTTKTGQKPNTKTTTKTEDVYGGKVENTRALFERLLEIIKVEEGKDGKTRDDGFEAAIEYMRTLGLPLMPRQETIDWIDNVLPKLTDKVKGYTSSFTGWIDRQAEDNRRKDRLLYKKHPWIRWLDRLIS